MSVPALADLGLAHGVWQARLTSPGSTQPEVNVTLAGEAVPGVAVTADGPGEWLLRVPVPVDRLSDGVQTVLVTDRESGAGLGRLTLIAGAPAEADLRAEIDLLRAELDMLKKAVRRLVSGG